MSATLHLVVPDPAGNRVLLVAEGEVWALPRVRGAGAFAERFVITEAAVGAREEFGLDIAVLRSVLAGIR